VFLQIATTRAPSIRSKMNGVERKGGIYPGVSSQGWFTETENMWPGQKFSLALDEFSTDSVIFYEETAFQSILVFRSAQYGNVLVLDGAIQLTERDEFAFHEMMVHLPLCAHSNPQRILIVGGGDGGILREICRHDCVKEIVLVEIDPVVIQVSKKFFSNSTATRFDDPRLRIIHADAADFLKDQKDAFDVIIGDTSDPVGPATSLFQPTFYESMHEALRDQGIICMQAESMWIHLDLISDLVACCDDMFDHAEYASTMVPTYPCGQIGFVLARKGNRRSCRSIARQPIFESDLKWYSPAQHRAAFTLPPFVTARLEEFVKGDEVGEDEEEYRCFLADPKCSIL
jgi:spermidine synthase